MKIKNTRAIVLAAGKSSRFKTEKSKLLYSVCGQEMILYPVKLLQEMGIPITVVVGYQADEIKKVIDASGIKVDYVLQEDALGTGHAVAATQKTWDRDNILVMNGDSPLLTQEIISELEIKHTNSNSVFTFLSAHALNPFGYGRVIKEKKCIYIIEDRNLTEDQRFVTLINAGIYLIKKDFLKNNIGKIKKDTENGEYYITDLVKIASQQGLDVKTIPVAYDNIRGINNLEELWAAEQIKRSQLIKYWMFRGVHFELAQSIHLDWDTQIGVGSFIGTGVHILNGTKIGKNCNINAFSIIDNSQIGDGSYVHSHSVIQDSKIGQNSHVGPYVRFRKGVNVGNNVNIGNFVEIKNSIIGDNTTAKHLSYLGDSIIGKNVNIGAGTVTCNYDGVEKQVTNIKDDAFIGSNNTLIAPLTIEKGSYTAGGSTINKDVPKNSLGIARCRQENKIDYVKTLKNRKSNKKEHSTMKKKESKLNFVGAVKTEDVKNL